MSFDDPAGVFDQYSDAQREKLRERMHEPVVDADTEWVEGDDGRRLRWTCGDCEAVSETRTRKGTLRCESCLRIMQPADYGVDPRDPDPENPDWYLERLARRRGKAPDAYKEEPEPEPARSW